MSGKLNSTTKYFKYLFYSVLSFGAAVVATSADVDVKKTGETYSIDYTLANVCHADTPSGGGYSESGYGGGGCGRGGCGDGDDDDIGGDGGDGDDDDDGGGGGDSGDSC